MCVGGIDLCMDNPLWCEKHRPDVDGILQDSVREYFSEIKGEKMNLLVHGPKGAGKTAAVRALCDASHGNTDADVHILNVADFFDRSKSEIRDDPRFEQFLRGQTEFSKQYRRSGDDANKYKRNWSKREMLTHVLKEMVSYESSTGDYKTVVLDNGEKMRGDLQQSLRRVIEDYYETTQFIIVSRSVSGVIPAIRSRLKPVRVKAPTDSDLCELLGSICEREDVSYTDEGIDVIVGRSGGDVRDAIMSLQSVASNVDVVDAESVIEEVNGVGVSDVVEGIVTAAENGNISGARDDIDTLLIDEGLSGVTVLKKLTAVINSQFDGETAAELLSVAARIDMDIREGANERVHVTNFVTEIYDAVGESDAIPVH